MLHIQTPLIMSTAMSRYSGRPIYLKMEALQPSGSFKLRGIGHACEFHYRRGVRLFLSSSGGNAGIAVAVAGRRLGVPARGDRTRVDEPTSTWRCCGSKGPRSEFTARLGWRPTKWPSLSRPPTMPCCILFDDPLLWTGHATMIDEVVAAGFEPDVVVVLSVGGGGLLCGVAEGLQRNGLGTVPILAVETVGADAVSRKRSKQDNVSNCQE